MQASELMERYASGGQDFGEAKFPEAGLNCSYQIYGNFLENLPAAKEQLSISFSPSSIPLKSRWRQNGISADFIADYFLSFFPDYQGNHSLFETELHIKESIGFIANELLENAMKYSSDISKVHTSITLQMHNDRLVFVVRHAIDLSTYRKLKLFIHKLLSSAPDELYIQQIEANSMDSTTGASRLGLLTMMNDYSASLGWKFESIMNRSEAIAVTTMVQLAV